MGTKPHRRAWLPAVAVTLGAWGFGAYLPAISNLWVTLNIVTPAGRPNIAAFPFAYPPVGIDGHTLASLVGLLLIVGGVAEWFGLLTKAGPTPAENPASPAPAPAQPQPSGTTFAPRPDTTPSVN